MTINSIFTLIFLIVCVFLTFSAFAQRTEDVIYLKNGSIIRGTITEIILNANVKIRTRDGNLLVFPMDEVDKIAKEPFLELERPKPYAEPQVSSRRASRSYMFSPLQAEKGAYSGLLVGAHSSLGMDFPMIGIMGMYDSRMDSEWLSLGSRQDLTYSVGFMGILEASPDSLWDTQGFDVQGHIVMGSGLVCLGSESSSLSYRLGAGISIASTTVESFYDESYIVPTALASITFFPEQVDPYIYVETFGVTIYARWQGTGAMIGLAIGLMQRGVDWW